MKSTRSTRTPWDMWKMLQRIFWDLCTKARSYLKKRIKKTAVTKKVPRFFLLYSCSKDSFLSHILLLFGKADPGQALRKYKETLPEWVGQERVTVDEKARKW